MAKNRTQVTLDGDNKRTFELMQKDYEKKDRQPPSLAQLANRAIRKGLASISAEVMAELK